ncbi:MAG: D-alanine--D-alanine ligase, partial [Oscillospiraceae bacterium]|nr:D-alanine--D-alanine ligase [Oscillospiraceae bacterium]
MDIVVLCGGLSAERDVSLSTGAMASAALRRLGHRVYTLDLFLGTEVPEDAVISDSAPDLDALRASRPGNSRVGERVFDLCRAADIVFMALHGEDGEDGKIQAAFDLLGVKYTGTGSLGSALAMNKSVTKQLFREHGILTPRGTVVNRRDAVPENIGFPCVVKPCSGGSSVGTSVVYGESGYADALEAAFRYDDDAIVEQYISGRECDVGVLAGRALPAIEIRPEGGFYDYKNKYQAGMATEICPADFPPEITKKLLRTAEDVFRTLLLEVYARMDFIVSESGEIYCLEGNTLPGLTPTSLLPQEAAAVGLGYDALIDTILHESLKKYGG